MKILAIETSTLTGSIALVCDGQLVGETTLSVSVQHSERLMPAVDQILRDSGVSAKDVDLYAVAEGPGSFTGLRIGISAAQGFSLSQEKPIVGVSTLEGLAMNGMYFPGTVIPVLNAFRGELYWRLDGQDRVSTAESMAAVLQNRPGPLLILGNGAPLCGDLLLQNLGDRVRIAPAWLQNPRAVPIATLAAQKFKEGLKTAPVLPSYLRKPG